MFKEIFLKVADICEEWEITKFGLEVLKKKQIELLELKITIYNYSLLSG